MMKYLLICFKDNRQKVKESKKEKVFKAIIKKDNQEF